MNANTENWPRPHRLTVEEYYGMSDAGLLPPDARVELIEGEIIDMAPIGSRHAAAVDLLAKRMIAAVGDTAIVGVQRPVRLSRITEPQPDLAILQPRLDRYSTRHPAPEDVLLLIEVSDATLRYDREVKAPLYASHGVPELWIVDLPGRVLHIYRDPENTGYKNVVADDSPAAIPLSALAGRCVDLTGVFF